MSETMSLPIAPGSATSEAAAKRLERQPEKIRAHHRSILNILLSGPKTDREIQSILGMEGSTERPRRGELVRMVRVRDSGTRRNGSTVWEIV